MMMISSSPRRIMPSSSSSRLAPLLVVVALAAITSIASTTTVASAMPLFFLTSPLPKCVSVDVPSGTFLHVKYEVPDLNAAGSNKGPRGRKQTILTISQLSEGPGGGGGGIANRRRRTKTPTTTTTIEQPTGKVMYKTEADGMVQACLRHQGASSSEPVRAGVQFVSGKDAAYYKNEEMEHHLSGIQVSILRLTDEIGAILHEADYAKEREMKFHSQSASMHAASQWWPIMQICVLFLTGFTQVTHMVRFFKSKRLV